MNEYWEEAREKEKIRISHYGSIFGTQTGKKVLEDLKKRTLNRSAFDSSDLFSSKNNGCSIELRDSTVMMLREGQNTVVRYICDMIEEYRKGVENG